MAALEVKVPDIGDFKDVEVIEVLVKPGDRVAAEQSLVTVESDKASMEIPSSAAGVVKEMKVKVGDKVNEGTLLLLLEGEGAGAAAPAAAAAATPVAAPAPAPTASSPGPRAQSAAPGGDVEVVVPDIGDFDEVAVIEVLVKPGDTVALEQSLVTVESDKASMEIPSSAAGVVKALKVKVGDKVSQGSVLAIVESKAGAISAGAATAPAGDRVGAAGGAPAPAPAPAPSAPAPAERHVPTAALPAHEPTAPTGTPTNPPLDIAIRPRP